MSLANSMSIHRQTPTLTVLEPRGLVARSVSYWRNVTSIVPQGRINRSTSDPAGRTVGQWDPRPGSSVPEHDSRPANLSISYSLSSQLLASVSVDAGLRVVLLGEARQPLEQWEGRGTGRRNEYDRQIRPLAVFETNQSGRSSCTERYAYGPHDLPDQNQCGRLIRHDDPAGVLLFNTYGLTGAVLEQERRFTGESSSGFVSHTRLTPLGDVQSRIDAQGNEQRFSQTLGGQLHAVDLRLSNTTEWLPMVDAITYNTHGQVEQEVAGNGVITTLEYSAEDGRLQRLVSRLGLQDPLQDLRYAYDPVGNVLSIEDAALPIRYFANQRIEPVNRYTYDSLSQLIEATGWEAGTVKHGPLSLPTESLANYRQTYRYDEGNNLLELTHVGAQNPGHRLVAAAQSNRCLPVRDGVEPDEEDFVKGFDANGNLLSLQPGQFLSWDLRNQLQEVRPVERETGPDDTERYSYGADGMRVRKIRSLQTNAQTNLIETRYLPSLEIRTHSGTGEELHVIEVKTGRSHVRVLHWESGRPPQIANHQQRYNLTDHLGSSNLELDQDANLITQERYYPFGGTAWSNGEAVQVSYKTVHYSGKERDATGLYYYGFRYYMPERQRWLSPDPAGAVEGLNFYRMVNNQPLKFRDQQGLAPVLANTGDAEENISKGLLSLPSAPIMYRVEYLEERLSIADEASQGRAKQVQDNFKHKVNPFISSIFTEPNFSELEKPSKFFNIYAKSEWEFKDNYKYSDSGGVFLNDISRHQIRLAADLNFLPSKIRRSKVRNEVTLSKTEALESGSDELLNVFFSQTPNGKATKRLMEEVGLEATAVYKEGTGKNIDFIVAVVPTGLYTAVMPEEATAPLSRLSKMRLRRSKENASSLSS